ncbi:MAG TPA: hypothetical protein VG146_08960 [Verrucomicrobiae bacterium]|nr:hypothetical protein [Verrucomicrobiae bacterium]
MNEYWNNLRPFEKRVVVAAGALLFIVLNLLFVFPHFSDLSVMQARHEEAELKIAKFEAEIAQTNAYMRGIRELASEGSDVPAEEQGFQFANTVQMQAGQSGVHPTSNSTTKTTTNQFFIEKSQSIGVQAGEEQLVNFLYNLGSGNSQIRVRDLNLRPDAPRQQLMGSVTLVASYQKTTTAKPGRTPSGPHTPGARGPSPPSFSSASGRPPNKPPKIK